MKKLPLTRPRKSGLTRVCAGVAAQIAPRLGPQLKRTSAECEATLEAPKNGNAPPAAPNFEQIRKQTVCGMTMGSSSANGARVTSMGAVPLERLLSQISTEIGAPVVDRTRLTGLFDLILEYASTRPQLQTVLSSTK